MRQLLFTFLLLSLLSFSSSECIHDTVQSWSSSKRAAQDQIPQSYEHEFPTADNSSPIRFLIDTTAFDNDSVPGRTCSSVGETIKVSDPSSSTGNDASYICQPADVLPEEKKSYLRGLLNTAHQMLTAAFNVVPVQAGLRMNPGQVGGFQGGINIPTTYNMSYNTDTVLFVTIRPIATANVLAVGVVLHEDQYARPIAGHLNFNPSQISIEVGQYQSQLGVALHEITHTLGFSSTRFSRLHVASGKSQSATSIVSVPSQAGNGAKSATMIVTPNVVSWVRSYFNCDSLQGAELEDQGGQGTVLSHWEKRLFNNEYMTGTSSRNPVFSGLTLSFFQDSGWYYTNMSAANQLLWGQGLGCSFTSRPCTEWPDVNGYFCNDPSLRGCSADGAAKAACQIKTYSSLDSSYQYFGTGVLKAGTQQLPDYCPYMTPYDNTWCFDPETNADSSAGEVISPTSKCFTSTLVKNLATGTTPSQICYRAACTGPNEIRVQVDDYWYVCPAKTNIKVIGYGGSITCPTSVPQYCGNVATDKTWPKFLTITPSAGGPKITVTITGANFGQGLTVTIKEPLIDVTVVSSNIITATIPNTGSFQNPANILTSTESVIITDAQGRSAVGYDAFRVQVSLNKNFIQNAFAWMAQNWFITAGVAAAILITCGLCGYCCCRKRKTLEADTEDY